MKVGIKQFNVDMWIKQKGIELEVRDPSGKKQIGDLVITMTKVTWCPGKTSAAKGKTLTWEKLISLLEANGD